MFWSWSFTKSVARWHQEFTCAQLMTVGGCCYFQEERRTGPEKSTRPGICLEKRKHWRKSEKAMDPSQLNWAHKLLLQTVQFTGNMRDDCFHTSS